MEFGYRGRLPVRDILRVGIKAIDAHCTAGRLRAKGFAQIGHDDQEAVLQAAEDGELPLHDIAAQVFFAQLLGETRLGYFCDPLARWQQEHGGLEDDRLSGHAGDDYSDWVEVRDKPYPLPPVDLAGRRG